MTWKSTKFCLLVAGSVASGLFAPNPILAMLYATLVWVFLYGILK